jgi:predicted O-methyltransferase YrrM
MAAQSVAVHSTRADLSFCSELAEIVASGRTTGESGRIFQDLGALSTLNNLRVLRAFMLQHRCERTLEVGLSFGGSALAIAATHRELHGAAVRQHTAIDPFQESLWDNSGVMALSRAGLSGYVEFRAKLSSVALAELVDEGRTFDLIYVDGSHRFDDVFVDAYFGLRLLSPNGVIFFDDSSTPDVAKVLRYVSTNWGSWTAEIDLVPYRSGGSSLMYRLGRWMGRVQLRAFRRTGGQHAWNAPLRPF